MFDYRNAYELYKRNHAILTVGGLPPKSEQVTQTTDGTRVTAKVYTTKITEHENIIECFFADAPKFTFSQSYDSGGGMLMDMIGQLGDIGRSVGIALDQVPGENFMDKIKNVGNAVKDGNWDMILSWGVDALSAETIRHVAPKMVKWSGQDPISFTVKLLFLNERGGPVYYNNTVKLLLALTTYASAPEDPAGTGNSWHMQGPVGFHGTTTGIFPLTPFLNQKRKTLHSLKLIKGDYAKGTGVFQTILDLRNILVIKSVSINTSSQLYMIDKERPPTKWGPAYQWVTADVTFATALPIPGPFDRHLTNVNNFFGINNSNSSK